MMPLSFHPQFVCLKKDLKVRIFPPPPPPLLLKPTLTSALPCQRCNCRVVSPCSQGLAYLDTDGFTSTGRPEGKRI